MKFSQIKPRIKDIPFILLFLDLISWVLSLFDIYLLDYWIVTEIASHSLLNVAFMAFYAYVHRYCLYSWVCIVGLGMLNVLNITNYFFNFGYVQLYAGLIIITSLTFAVIKWKQSYYK